MIIIVFGIVDKIHNIEIEMIYFIHVRIKSTHQFKKKFT